MVYFVIVFCKLNLNCIYMRFYSAIATALMSRNKYFNKFRNSGYDIHVCWRETNENNSIFNKIIASTISKQMIFVPVWTTIFICVLILEHIHQQYLRTFYFQLVLFHWLLPIWVQFFLVCFIYITLLSINYNWGAKLAWKTDGREHRRAAATCL